MTNEQLQTTLSYLDKIGEKIDKTAQQMWPWFIKQQYIEAIISGILLMFFSTLTCILYKKLISMPSDERWKYVNWYNVPLVISLILTCIFIPVFIVEFSHVFNPELHALIKFITTLKIIN